MNIDIGIVRLAHRTPSPLGETFVRILQEVDAEVSEPSRSIPPSFIVLKTTSAQRKAWRDWKAIHAESVQST